MRLTRSALLASTTLSLIAATPAGALSGSGITGALQSGQVATDASKKHTAAQTCQAGSAKNEKTPGRSALIGKRKFAVVACEQPPRSQLTPNLITQAAAALGTIG